MSETAARQPPFDRWPVQHEDPRYGYAHHKGYATAEHLAAVARYGYSSLHRRSFKPQSSLFDTMEEFPPPAEFE